MGKPRIGVLALQGDFEEHLKAIEEAGGEGFLAKTPEDLEQADGLIIPGGESTTLLTLIRRHGLTDAFYELKEKGKPVFGTCAGLILMAREVVSGDLSHPFGFLDIGVERNAYGRQRESFEAQIEANLPDKARIPAVFIRAPRIARVGEGVEVLGTLEGEPVWVRQGPFMASTFHPELTPDRTVHRLFLEMVRGKAEKG